MRLLIAHSLGRAGHTVYEAPNGQEAIDLVRVHAPDAWVFDLQMPTLGGLEAIAQLRAEGLETPAILLTASRDEAAPDPRTRVVAKPLSPPRLIGVVAEVLTENS